MYVKAGPMRLVLRGKQRVDMSAISVAEVSLSSAQCAVSLCHPTAQCAVSLSCVVALPSSTMCCQFELCRCVAKQHDVLSV